MRELSSATGEVGLTAAEGEFPVGLSAFDQSLLAAIPAGVAQLGPDGSIVAVNPRWQLLCTECSGMLPDFLSGGNYADICRKLDEEGEPQLAASQCLADVLAGAQKTSTFVHAFRGGVSPRWFRVHLSYLSFEDKPGALVMYFDVTEDVQAERRLFDLAHFDQLTGLPNRLLFVDRLASRLALASRHETGAAVVYFNIDRFKMIADMLGHGSGDVILRVLSERVIASLRESDSVGHLGGDDFAVILSDLPNDSEAAVVARKVMSALDEPFKIRDQDLSITVSMGIATYPDDAGDPETLLRFAEIAMGRAKEAGRNCYQYYTTSMNQGVAERLKLDADLRQALAREEFELFYQPKVSCTNGEVIGSEALLRWNHPVRGLLSPAMFVEALEESGLIKSVGRWALRQACCQLKQWLDQDLGRPTVAVNVSAKQFEGSELLDSVRDALAISGLPPDRLELELTESVLMRNVEQVIATLTELRLLGVRFSVDDFGTGYSSLSYLKRFPIDAVKVDRSFVQDITANPDDASITRAVITMAHNLKLKVIAEGVETDGQLSLLIANHCDVIQGYFFSKPVPAAEMARILADRSSIPALPVPPAKRQRTVLLVDDEENILASLRRLLRRDGYQILTANGGAAGLEVLARNEVDVIVSDQRMPGMTGVEFLRRVKTIHPRTVRMVLSGYTELQSITDAINEGAIYKFLTKPWEDDLLRANIEEAFRYKELADENRRLNSEVQVANIELAKANAQLMGSLAEKERRIERDEMSLGIAQEILQCVPFPVLGVDEDGILVFANQASDRLLGGGSPLMGRLAEESLPEPLVGLIAAGAGEKRLWLTDSGSWLAVSTRLGEASGGSGLLLTLYPSFKEADCA
ncbi:MAG: diguanylate cyclase protein [Proteobacteria bacterium]|nr:diguanylate cyclase protein [Pseudomonadota bacterium]